jgi:DNA-binding NarL/FixJ family response regulator
MGWLWCCNQGSAPQGLGAGFEKSVQLIRGRRVRIQGQKWSLSIRVLLVDDFENWRRQVRSLLQAQPAWQVIAEASDGSEAVQRAEDLKPDLVLLDIGLPKLNGIEAARRIRQCSPDSKIIFLSQNRDLDVFRAALGTGALGYVLKMDAGRELLLAVDAVLRGRHFISSSLKGDELTDASAEKAAHVHEVQFYSDDALLLDSFARFIAVALKSGRAAIAVITESRSEGLVSRLKEQGLDVDAATQHGTYIQLDVNKTFSTFMVNGMPDSARFFPVAGGLIEAAAKAARQQHHGVAVCGEGASVLWAEGKFDAAIRLEQLWDEVGKTFGVDILCGYALSNFHGEKADVLQSICAEHSSFSVK